VKPTLIFSVREIGLPYQCPVADPIPVPFIDTIRPTVSITAPVNGATVSGIQTITAVASDNVAIASVRFSIDSVNFGPAVPGPGPYTIPWDTRLFADGNHEIIAVATDTSGNQTVSAAVDVDVENFVALDNFTWLMPISSGSHATDPDDVVVNLGGNPLKTYAVTLRFRGIVEWKNYSGGVQTSHFYTGGVGADPGTLPSNTIRNIYSIAVSDPAQVYYLNAYLSGTTDGVFVIDYNETISMQGGSSITLHATSVDNLGFENLSNLTVPVSGGDPPIMVSQPYAGQFVQMNIVSIVEA
jgi:hypothetical protein